MKTYLLLIACCLGLTNSLSAQEIEGTWNGLLKIQGTELRLVMHIEKTADGFSTTLDSPDQGANGIATDKTTFADGTLTVEAAALAMVYTGTFKDDGTIGGTFSQGGGTIPLDLSREAVEKEPLATRPQDPTDFPYYQQEVSFSNPSAEDVTLAGTLTLPESGTPKAVVVLVSGSGPQDRNEEIGVFNHRPFLVLSDYLTRQGIGVLRYDDRGVAASTGSFSAATTADFASDASAAINYLASRDDLEGVQLGIVGHSEGGMIAPIVAVDNEAVDFIALLAGPGTAIDELMLEQSRLISTSEGATEEEVAVNQTISREIYRVMKAHKDSDEGQLREALEQTIRRGMDAFPEEIKSEIGDVDEFIDNQLTTMLSPWFRYFITFEPATYLEKVKVPVLAINGSLDLQVPAGPNLAAIEAALRAGGNPDLKIAQFEGLNHLFQQATTGAVSEYGEIEETINPAALEMIANWIQEQTR